MASYTVVATNWATAVENKIHDDEVARRYGFGGGLVPGVTLYGYMARPIVEAWGPEWFERGEAAVRFVHPVYDGEVVTTTVTDTVVELRNEGGTVCATGTAGLGADPVDVPALVRTAKPLRRPPADEDSLAPGRDLGSVIHVFDGAAADDYLDLIGDDLDCYRGRRAVAHPGWLVLDANEVLAANVKLGPWIHVGSEVRNLRPVTIGDEVVTDARVRANYERKGHHLVELDVIVSADGAPAAVIHHTAIWRVRLAE